MNLLTKKGNFKDKLLQSFALAIVFGTLAAFVAISLIEYKRENQDLIDDIEVIANIVGNRSVAALVFNDPEAGVTNLSATRHHESIELACLYDHKGNLFSAYASQSSQKKCDAAETSVNDNGILIENGLNSVSLSVPIVDMNETLGHITMYSSKSVIYAGLIEFGLIIIVVFVSLWFVIIFLAKRALQGIMQPLDELYSTARDITTHNLSDTRAKKLSDDEIGELVVVFNQMLDSIASENRALVVSESRFRSLAENSPVGIFQKNASGELLYTNNRWHALTGLGEQSSDTQFFVNNILDTYRRQYNKSWSLLCEQSNTQVMEFGYRNPVTDTILSFMEYISPIHSEDGKHQSYIGTLLDVTELKDAQKELEKLAFYDPLTGLPNRRFFRNHLNYLLAEAERGHSQIAIMMLDLDNFKKVNDSLGHDMGDSLLKIVSDRMLSIVSGSCVISRMGGDEFLFLSLDTNAEEAANLGQHILEKISEPIDIEGHTLEIGGSFGITLYPADGVTAHDLIKNADMALYNAKDKGRNTVNFYSSELDKKMRDTLRLEGKLLKAIQQRLLRVYLQPQYSTIDKKIVWAEALLRWPDEDEGFIPPDKFIPLAENLGVIHKLGNYVIEKSCSQLQEHKYDLQSVGINGISINLSASELFSPNFLSNVRSIFSTTNVCPSCIDFEVTESIMMNDIKSVINIMNSLRDLGCKLSIDDFGTGYSSLSYLKRFPITSLKIDRSFVKDIPHDSNDIEICTAIIAMAHKLGLTVVAEGIETEAQRDFLTSQGCESLQGYLFSRPHDIHEFIKDGHASVLVN